MGLEIDISKTLLTELFDKFGAIKVYLSRENINKLLDLTKCVIWESEFDGCDYYLAGTCFPIIIDGDLFIATAAHVIDDARMSPTSIMYFPVEATKSSFIFSEYLKLDYNKCESLDFCLLKVLNKGLMLNRQLSTVSNIYDNSMVDLDEIIDVYLRGFPNSINGIKYDPNVISTQAYLTNGFQSIKYSDDGTLINIRFKTPTSIEFGDNPSGISGAPVYAITRSLNCVFLGIVITYNKYTEVYQIISRHVIYDEYSKRKSEFVRNQRVG